MSASDPPGPDRLGRAMAALVARDNGALDALLEEDPALVTRTARGNTLLEWVTQPAMTDMPMAVVDVLIARGAALDRALNLAACFNRVELCERLLIAGADPTARADADVTPLETAAMHGASDAADVLVRHGLHRPSLWLAAAAGELAMVQDWVADDGRLLKPAGPYRPDLESIGRAAAGPRSDTPRELIGEAFVFAAANGRLAVVNYLLRAGVSVDVRPYRNTTALHFAVQFRKASMVSRLLSAGAATDIRDGVYDSDAAGWASACDNGSAASKAISAHLCRDTPP